MKEGVDAPHRCFTVADPVGIGARPANGWRRASLGKEPASTEGGRTEHDESREVLRPLGGEMEADVLEGFWGDAGESIEAYYAVNDFVRNGRRE